MARRIWWRRSPAWRATWLAGLAVALVATVPAWLPWLDPRLDPNNVDDARNHILRLLELDFLLQRGQWFPRWEPDLFMGYGYPLLNFYAPGAYYLSLLLSRLLGLGIWDGFRAAGVVAALVGTAGAYAFATAVWRHVSLGVLAALTLLYGPYVFQINLLKRGDVPEALGLGLLPWLLLALWRVWHVERRDERLRWVVTAALLGAAELLTHNVSALLAGAVAAVWVAYLLVVRPRWAALRWVLNAGVVALGLTAFFWLPAVGEARLVQVDQLAVRGLRYYEWFLQLDGNSEFQVSGQNRQTRTGLIDTHLRYPHQLIASPKVSLGQVGLGILAAGSAALTLIALRKVPRERRAALLATVPLLAVAVPCWLLAFDFSAPVWERVPGLQLLQFPWRLMGPLGVCIALAGAGALAPLLEVLGRWRSGTWAGGAVVTVVAALVVFNHTGDRTIPRLPSPPAPFDGQTVVDDERSPRLVRSMGTTGNGEFLPRTVFLATYTEGVPRGRPIFEHLFPEQDWLGGYFQPLGGDLRFLGWTVRPLALSVRVANDAATDGTVGVRQAGFAGWRAWIDGRPAPVGLAPYVPEQQASLGFMMVSVPPGEHTVSLAFGPSRLRLVGIGLTLVTAALGAAWLAAFLVPSSKFKVQSGAPRLGGNVRPVAVWGVWAVVVLGVGYAAWRGVWPMLARSVQPPVAAAADGRGVWRAPILRTGDTTLLVNVAEAVRTGRAAISSPSGAALGADKFVDVRQQTITDADALRGWAGTSRREWLFLHPPSSASLDLELPAGQEVWFQAALGMDPAAWTAPVGDGVRFRATVTPLGGQGSGGPRPGTTTVVDQDFNPRAHGEHRRWVPVAADLTPWSGQTVRLTLETQPHDDLSFDWAGWGNPMVSVRDSLRPWPTPSAK